MKFRGSFVAMITPFVKGAVDEDALVRLVDWLIEKGSHGLVPGGTTGESSTLSREEHERVISLCVNATRKRVPVVAGTGSNSTAEAIALTAFAEKAGADAALVVTPYYNKPSAEGVYQHFKAVHDAVSIPIILYNIPSRCVIDISNETMTRLAELPRIVGVKDSTANMVRPLQAIRSIRKDFTQFSGDDATSGAFLAQGGDGCISVAANVAPLASSALQNAWLERDIRSFHDLNLRLSQLWEALALGPNPSPVKYAASLLGLCTSEVRLPLCEAEASTKTRIELALRELGLLDR